MLIIYKFWNQIYSVVKRNQQAHEEIQIINYYTEKSAALLLSRNKINMKALLCAY